MPAPALCECDSIGAKIDIAELISRYANAIRHRDAIALGALFTDDGSFEVRFGPAEETAKRHTFVEGKAALMTYLEQVVASDDPVTPLIHNIVIALEPDGMSARAESIMVGVARDGTPRLMGIYHDSFAKSHTWRFRTRRFTIIGLRD